MPLVKLADFPAQCVVSSKILEAVIAAHQAGDPLTPRALLQFPRGAVRRLFDSGAIATRSVKRGRAVAAVVHPAAPLSGAAPGAARAARPDLGEEAAKTPSKRKAADILDGPDWTGKLAWRRIFLQSAWPSGQLTVEAMCRVLNERVRDAHWVTPEDIKAAAAALGLAKGENRP